MPVPNLILDTVQLPPDVFWVNEFGYNKIRTSVDHTVTGALEIQQSVEQKGRPIVLASETETGWVTRQQILDLQTLAETVDHQFTLTLPDLRTFTVMFDYSNGNPVEATPLQQQCVADVGQIYLVTIKLIEV